MRTVLVLGWIGICCATGSAEVLGKVTVVTDDALVHRGATVIAKAKKGQTYEVTGINGDWYGVMPVSGWIHKKHVRFEAAATAEPAASTGDAEIDALLKGLEGDADAKKKAARDVHRMVVNARSATDREQAIKRLEPVFRKFAVATAGDDIPPPSTVAEIFVFARTASPHAAAFARGLLAREPSEQIPHPWPPGLRVANELRVKDDGIKQELIRHLPQMTEMTLQQALQYLSQQFPDDPGAAAAVAALLDTEDRSTLRSVILCIGRFSSRPGRRGKAARDGRGPPCSRGLGRGRGADGRGPLEAARGLSRVAVGGPAGEGPGGHRER